ncbi:MAG: Crp/Fnr family transcriptional regulator [Oscillospiraceae bacterium]|jgi:CRP-like cAMP-binding protein|nr:Crp/Fnr family transcriptional regulator [Oscillospiraceae bacterium]
MKNIFGVLSVCPLFQGIAESDLSSLLACLSSVRRRFAKGDFVFSADDAAAQVGVVLEGGVNIIQEDYWGNRVILSHVETGELFGEAFACAGVPKLPVSVVAAEASVILLIDLARIVTTCSSACAFHAGMLQNLLQILARKNLSLIRKMEHVTRRTTREKLLSYLSARAKEVGYPSFDVPFNRQEMADYLAVDRSAMSAELSKMQSDGLLTYARSHFELRANS